MPSRRSDSPSRPLIERLVYPLQIFGRHQLAGAGLLIGATVVALVWANSPWAESYYNLLGLELTVGLEAFSVSKPLLLWINDGLMGIFFFVVGLEIKRELLIGELSSVRKATLPFAAAIGGMVGPAAIYILLNPSGPGAAGWGIPMATDIAFSLGVLTMLGDRVPVSLKVFLTALAIVDDIGAILVIAIFYTDSISMVALAVGGGAILVSILANRAGMRSSLAFFFLGAITWLAFLKSGLHATLAAVLIAFTIPARTRIDQVAFAEKLDELVDAFRSAITSPTRGLLSDNEQHVVDEISFAIGEATAPLQRLEHGLMPVVTFVVLPVFALANAGVSIGGDFLEALAHPIALGIIAGLIVGKQIGITGAAWLAVKLKVADLPRNVNFVHVWGVSLLAAIGFTMSLFINGLAFDAAELQNIGKSAILAASLVAAIAGYSVLWLTGKRYKPPAEETAATHGV